MHEQIGVGLADRPARIAKCAGRFAFFMMVTTYTVVLCFSACCCISLYLLYSLYFTCPCLVSCSDKPCVYVSSFSFLFNRRAFPFSFCVRSAFPSPFSEKIQQTTQMWNNVKHDNIVRPWRPNEGNWDQIGLSEKVRQRGTEWNHTHITILSIWSSRDNSATLCT